MYALTASDLARFWSRIDTSGDCWLWQASMNEHGYGQLQIRNKMWKAHRVSYLIYYGVLPVHMFVLHRCDTPACVRPEHLFLGDQLTNLRDAWAKGRMHRGSAHWRALLTDADVQTIRQRRKAGARYAHLAREYGVSETTVRDLVMGRTWRHVPTDAL